MFYKKNLPVWERIARVLGALMLAFGAYYYGISAIGIVCGLSAVIAVTTGLFGYCPVCHIGGRKPVANA